MVGRPRDHRGRGLRRAGPAPDPGAVRQADGRPPDVRRHVTYIPLKVNQAGVIPVIFASSLLYLPGAGRRSSTDRSDRLGWATWVQNYLVTRRPPALHAAPYFLLIIFFTYFYVAITFNPTEVADNMKKYGGFIPGIRAGRPTAEYLDYVLTRITLPGALYLGLDRADPARSPSALVGREPELPVRRHAS